MSTLTIVFGGTPEFAVPTLTSLVEAGYDVVAVYTQPDKPAGRGRQLKMSAIKECAQRLGLRVEQPRSLKEPSEAAHLAAYRPDLMVVVAYGLILPQSILDIPRLGCVNVHASLLPRWRGAAPIQRALWAGDVETGVSIMRMEAGLDTGPVLGARATAIEARESAATLHDRLARLGASTLLEAIELYAQGAVTPKPQPEEGVTYAHKIRKEEATIDWRQPTMAIDRQVRALHPWPIAETRWQGKQLRVWEADPHESSSSPPGTVLEVSPAGILVATGSGALRVTRLQLEGRKPMAAADFLNAHKILGERLG